MPTTLSDLQTMVARDLRDTSNLTWSTSELSDLINAGIAHVSDLAPREIMQTVGTVASGVYSYSVTGFSYIYRVDIYTAAGSYDWTVPNIVDAPDSGWEMHGGVLYIPQNWNPLVGSTVRVWGYGLYTQLSASTSTTDLTDRLVHAVRLYAQIEGLGRLINDKAAFAQWQGVNSDATLLGLNQTYFSLRRRWGEESRSIRRMRK